MVHIATMKKGTTQGKMRMPAETVATVELMEEAGQRGILRGLIGLVLVMQVAERVEHTVAEMEPTGITHTLTAQMLLLTAEAVAVQSMQTVALKRRVPAIKALSTSESR